MAKEATPHDVQHGMEHRGQKLCRWPSLKPGGKPAWSLEPDGKKVPNHLADKTRSSPNVELVSDSRFGEDRYAWRKAAP